jgi:hypothetical protein
MVDRSPGSHSWRVSDPVVRVRPEAMRELVGEYVRAVHTTYLDHVAHLPPAVRGALPLVAAGGVTVVAAATQRLHLVATTDRLPAPAGPEVALADEHRGVAWTVRFFDPSVLPELGVLADDGPHDVRRVLGIADTVYHLTVAGGGGLTGHHAQHSGVALANQHAKALRDLDRIRRAMPGRQRIVEELGVCARLGLDRAAALLARDLTSGRVVPAAGVPAASCLDAVLDDVDR